jgi:hypothetical protein
MANTSRPNGFRPIKYLNGAAWNGQATRYAVATNEGTAIYTGDLVKINGGADPNGIRAVTRAAASDAVVGPVIAVEVVASRLNTPESSVAASAAGAVRYVFVADDPNLLFEAEAFWSTTTAGTTGGMQAASVGLNYNFTVGTPSTTTGQSGMLVDVTTATTTNTFPLKAIEVTQRVDNEIGQYDKVIVKINKHQLVADTGAAGV